MGEQRTERRYGETAQMWVSRLEAAKDAWGERESERDVIREVVGKNLRFPILMFSGTAHDRQMGREIYHHIDQLDVNLLLRYVQKLRSLAGDEEPEVRFSRDYEGWQEAAVELDLLTTRLLGEAGAPDEMSDATQDACVEGLPTLWVLPPQDFISAEDVQSMGISAHEAAMRAVAGDGEDFSTHDPLDIARAAQELAMSPDLVVQDPSGELAERLIDVRTRFLKKHKEERRAPVDWRTISQGVWIKRLPYGTHALMDPAATSIKNARWVADCIVMDMDDAKRSPYLRPAFRERLSAEYPHGDPKHDARRLPDQTVARLDPKVRIWRIWDMKYRAVQLVHEGCDIFGNDDDTYPFVDKRGRPIIQPLSNHPGFFPCWIDAPLKPSKDDHQRALGIPLLLVGLKIALAVTKDVSFYHQAVKRASTTQYVAHPGMDDDFLAFIQANIDGQVTKAPSTYTNETDMGKAISAIKKEMPPAELFRLIDELVNLWCIVQSFPKAELTTIAQADTATQEKMAQAGGDRWMSEVVRKFEVAYGWVALQTARFASFLPQQRWVEMIGKDKADLLRGMYEQFGIPNHLPKVRFAAGERDKDPVRIKQGLDLHERVKVEIDPLLGLPLVDGIHLLDEASRALGFGPLKRKKYSDQMLQNAIQMRGGGGGGEGGGGPQEKGGGSQTGKKSSAEQKRDRPRQRGGRRGRSSNNAPHGKEEGASNDVGPM